MKIIRFFILVACWPALSAGQSVVINEIAWMGTSAAASDEWIELMNTQDRPVDLTGWRLQAADGSPNIALSGIINGHGCFLLERTDDTTLLDITADQIYTGDLKNSGEGLLLYDQDSLLVDAVRCDSAGWYAGSNTPKRSMERRNPLLPGSDPDNWADNDSLHTNGQDAKGNVVFGTPRQMNSVFDLSLAVSTHSLNMAPRSFCSVFPNPSLRYMIFAWSPGPGEIAVEIVDLLGRRVRTWQHWPLRQGMLLWDGRDDQGLQVASGIYFGRLIQDGRVLASVRLLRQR